MFVAAYTTMAEVSMFDRESNNRQSLISAMDKFFQACNHMDDTIMMPSRLMDVPLSDCDDEHTDKIRPPTNGKSNGLVPYGTPTTDLHSFYTMLKAIRSDLLTGPPTKTEDLEDDELRDGKSVKLDEHTHQVAEVFHHHLSGLFSVLGQLTDAAQYLTVRYQDQLNMDAGKSNL